MVKRTLATSSYLRAGSGSPVSKVTYGNGDYVQFGYDKYDRETSKRAETGALSTSTYNAKGQLARLNDLAAGITYHYSYDLLGRLINTRSSGANSDSSRYAYDNMNRMVGNSTTVNGYVIGNTCSYGSDSLVTKAWQGSYYTDYVYDNLNRVTGATMKNSGDTRTGQQVRYSYAAGANGSSTALVSGVEYLRGGVSDGSITYTYDNGGNIRTITESGKTVTYSYDGLNQLVREDNQRDNKSCTYSYNAGGNITAKSEYAYTTGALGTPNSTISYGYGDADWKDLMTSCNGQSITYDAIGNPLTYRDGMTMTWQRGRQLASLQKGSTAVNYGYGEDGLRTKKTVAGAVTNYHWNDLDQLVEQDGANGTLLYYHDDKGDIGAVVFNGAKYSFRRNAQGDVTAILDIANNIVAKYTYDAWGKVLSVTDANGNAITDPNHIANINPIRYRGYYYDTETGLYYLNSRYYDPETYRMLTADDDSVLQESQKALTDKNLFSYCDNNPIMRVDTKGEFWQFALAGGGIMGASWGSIGASVLGALGAITPVGWVVIGVTLTAVAIGAGVYYAKSHAPKGRPELKKQGREKLEKKKSADKNFKTNPNKRQEDQPKPHHPSKKGHRKYPAKPKS